MKKTITLFVILSFMMSINAQNPDKPAVKKIPTDDELLNMNTTKEQTSKIKDTKSMNPFIQVWDTPYQTPPFNEIRIEHYMPAFKNAIAEGKQELYKIKAVKSVPTFENTIVALDRMGKKLTRVSNVFFNMLSCNTSPELQKLSQEISPMLTEYSNDIYLDQALFERVKFVYDHEKDKLAEEDLMLLDKTYKAFVRSGANLSEEDKKRFRDISMKLSTLSLDFGQNVLASTNEYYKNITDKKMLSGIPEGDLAIAAEKAKAKKLKGWVFDLSAPSYLTVLKYADNRELRKEMYLKFNAKAYQDKYDNSDIIKNILFNRNELAQLMECKNYAEYALQDRMAENPDHVYKLLKELLEYSYPVAKEEIASLQQFASQQGFKEELQRWDFSYYSEKQRNALFDLSDEMLKPYFKLENVIDGVFQLATKLYRLEFVPNQEIQIYHSDVKVYEVYRDKQFLAILYLDFHPRASKRDGAWMTSFREQYIDEKGNNIRPLVSLVMNFTPSTPKNPSLLAFSEVRTFMHEFGHALHGMLSQVKYESISGTSVPRDFVELPSQMMENWAVEQDFLNTFAFHYKTNAKIPEDLIKKIKEADNFQAGYASCRQLSFGFLDMMWHTADPSQIENILKMERTVMDEMELFPVVSNTCMSSSFSHIFSGGYAAGYYGYKWAEVLDADAFSLFQETGIFDPKTADSFCDHILSKGGSEKPMELFVAFRGRQPQIDALLIRSGLKK